ncbi:MAG: OmpA family protein [Desulfovibrionaceae bacterium]
MTKTLPTAIRLFFGLVLVLLAACNNFQPSITQQSEIVTDAEVDRSELAIHVRPADRLHTPPKALLYPMWIREQLPERLELGRQMGRVLHGLWAGELLFPTLAYDERMVFHGRDKALDEARRRGADLLILPIVPYIYTGGSVDDTAMTLQLEIYDTKSRQLIFSMLQAGRMEFQRNKDWILWVSRTRMPDSPLYAIIRALGRDMAVPLASWLPPFDPRMLGYATNSQEIVDGLTRKNTAGLDLTSTDLAREIGATQGDTARRVFLKVEFDVDKSFIRPQYTGILDELGQALNSPELKGKKVTIIGHTDSDASDQYNMALSHRRSASVRDYLTKKHGIDPKLLLTDGRGEREPLVPNSSPANKQLNRRVEVRLVE